MPGGRLGDITPAEVERAARWDGETGAFFAVLLDLRWLDRRDDGLKVHGWTEHNGWASGAAKRSRNAQIAAIAKHKKAQRLAAVACAPALPSSISISSSISESITKSETTLSDTAPSARSDGSVRRVKRNRNGQEPPDFPAFYLAYPRHIGRSAAVKAWSRLTPDERGLAAGRLPLHVGAWNREGRELRVIPHPATWINGRRWEDEIPANGNGSVPSEPALSPRLQDWRRPVS